ncbi:hypothetical protein OROHE_005782 [Orobanche hederae]
MAENLVPKDEDVVIKQHKVVSVRAVNEVGNINAAILHKLGEIRNQLNLMNVRMIANGARFFNGHIDSSTARTTNFSQVVKYLPDHPAVVPAVPGVHFEDAYAINTPPPDGLMPLNFEELDTMGDVDNLAQFRRRLRAICWFYNDPRLALGPNANRAQCNNVLRSLIRFITFP